MRTKIFLILLLFFSLAKAEQQVIYVNGASAYDTILSENSPAKQASYFFKSMDLHGLSTRLTQRYFGISQTKVESAASILCQRELSRASFPAVNTPPTFAELPAYYRRLGEKYASPLKPALCSQVIPGIGKMQQKVKDLAQKLKDSRLAGDAITLVAYSQGNNYADAAIALLLYQGVIQSQFDIRVIGVASPTFTFPSSLYVNSSKDLVIYGILGESYSLPSTVDVCISQCTGIASVFDLHEVGGSINGHYLASNYLNEKFLLFPSQISLPESIVRLIDGGVGGSFFDDFSTPVLDPLKWTVESLGGHLATYSLSGGFLNIDVPGGSCGACGIADGARFKPRVDPLIGDFEMVISAEEIERLSRDRTRPLSDLQLLLTGTSTELGIFVIGDATNNQGNPGHRIVAYYRDGNSVVYPLIKDLTIGQYSAFQFKIRRVKGVSYLAYKIAPDTTWTEAVVPASFPSNAVFIPSIVVASGDGGGTGTNSSYKLKIDSVAISK